MEGLNRIERLNPCQIPARVAEIGSCSWKCLYTLLGGSQSRVFDLWMNTSVKILLLWCYNLVSKRTRTPVPAETNASQP